MPWFSVNDTRLTLMRSTSLLVNGSTVIAKLLLQFGGYTGGQEWFTVVGRHTAAPTETYNQNSGDSAIGSRGHSLIQVSTQSNTSTQTLVCTILPIFLLLTLN